MKYSKEQHDWLDEVLREALHATDVGPDFETWKKAHRRAIEALRSIDPAVSDEPEDQETQP